MPIDRGAIDAQLRDIGEGERWWEQREFRDLPHVMHPDERIQGIVNGQLLGARRPRIFPGAPWLIVATNSRLICLKQERFARRQIEVAAGQIVRLHQKNRFRSYQITFDTPLQRFRIRIARADAFRFTAALAPLMPPTTARPATSPLDSWAWIPGITTVAALPGVTEIASRFAMLTTPPVDSDRVDLLQASVDRLQNDLDRLQLHVTFLEDLLQKRAEESVLSRSSGDP